MQRQALGPMFRGWEKGLGEVEDDVTGQKALNDESLAIVRSEERPWGFLVHALGWIPVWGFVLNSLLWLYFKNRSREMIFHVQQAIQFQIYVLVPVLVWIICSIFIVLIGNISQELSELLQTLNNFLLIAVLTCCACLGVAGGALVYAGKPFLYPVFGRRVLEGSIRKIMEG